MKISFSGLVLVLKFTGGFSTSLKAQINCPQGAGKLILDDTNPGTGKIYTRTLSIGENLITCGCIYKNTDPLFKLEKTRINVSWINKTGQGGVKINRDICDTGFHINSMGIDPRFTHEIRHPDKAVKAEFYSATQANLESAQAIARQMIAQVENNAAYCNYGSNPNITVNNSSNSNNQNNTDICGKNFEKLRLLLEKKSGINQHLKTLQDNSYNETESRDKLSMYNKLIVLLNDTSYRTHLILNNTLGEPYNLYYNSDLRSQTAVSYGLNPNASALEVARTIRDVTAAHIEYYKGAPVIIQRQKKELAATEAEIERLHNENSRRQCPGNYDINSCDLSGEWNFTRWDTDPDNGTFNETWTFAPVSKGRYTATNQIKGHIAEAEIFGRRVKFSVSLRPDYSITYQFLLNEICDAGGGNIDLKTTNQRLEVKRSEQVRRSFVQDNLYDLVFNQKNYQGLYQKESDNGVPIDIFFFSINHSTGYQVEQDGQKLWGRFVRKPSTDHPDQSRVQWWFSNWVLENGRWVKKDEEIATAPKIR